MRKIHLKIIPRFKMALVALLCFSASIASYAQCLNATYGEYPSGSLSLPSCDLTFYSVDFWDECYAGEYSSIEVEADSTYTFQSTINTDFITISTSDGVTALASGTSSVTWVATFTGVVRFYTHVDASCGEEDSPRGRLVRCGIPPPPATNDNATSAITLTVGAPCSGAAYTNASASSAIGEPYANCHSSSTGNHSVWFSFEAPASGAVKITTDNGTAGSLDDTKIGLFAATNVSDYSTFTLLACDEDNGVDNDTTDLLSTIFATGLTAGVIYYVEVDGYDATQEGSFCVQVQEINPTMLSNSASCANIASPYGGESTYTGWVTLLDADGKLVALARNTAGGEAGSYYGSYNIDGNGFGTPRQDANGVYYLSRNFNINNDDVTSPVELQFFFHPGEIATLSGVTGNATTISNLNVTRQAGSTCNADFAEGNGATSVLLQTANGTVNGVGWIQTETPGFSNFYLMGGTTPLYVELKDISALNEGNHNKISWGTAREERGDRFELERSADSRSFSLLARVNGKGAAADYTYLDQSPLNGVNYYRLKLMHNDGKTSYSKVVSATYTAKGGAFEVKALPNPVSHMLKVMISGGSADAVVTLSDVTGKTLHSYKVTGTEVDIDMRAMAQGMYFVKYNDGSHTQTIKVSKQ